MGRTGQPPAGASKTLLATAAAGSTALLVVADEDAAVVVVVAADVVAEALSVDDGWEVGDLTEVEPVEFPEIATAAPTLDDGGAVPCVDAPDEGAFTAAVGVVTASGGPGTLVAAADVAGPPGTDEPGVTELVAFVADGGVGARLADEAGVDGGVVASREAGVGDDGSAANAGAAARVAVATMDEIVSRARRDMVCSSA